MTKEEYAILLAQQDSLMTPALKQARLTLSLCGIEEPSGPSPDDSVALPCAKCGRFPIVVAESGWNYLVCDDLYCLAPRVCPPCLTPEVALREWNRAQMEWRFARRSWRAGVPSEDIANRRSSWTVEGCCDGPPFVFAMVWIPRDGPKTAAEVLRDVEREHPLWFGVKVRE